jgi:phage gpG-like protein
MIVVESSQKNFIDGGRPKWPELSPITIALRRKGKGAGEPQPLRDTGVLMASIGNKSSIGIYVLKKDSLRLGTAVSYAAAHQDGVKSTKGFIKGKKIPARPFLVIQDEDETKILDLAGEFVDGLLKDNR